MSSRKKPETEFKFVNLTNGCDIRALARHIAWERELLALDRIHASLRVVYSYDRVMKKPQ